MDDMSHILESIEAAGLPVPQPLTITSENLYHYLRRWHVPLSSKWGKGRAKTLSTLQQQLISDNEALLYETRYRGRLRGVLYRRVVTIRTYYDVPCWSTAYDRSNYRYENGTVVEGQSAPVAPRALQGRLLLTEHSQEYGIGPFRPVQHPNNISETARFGESLSSLVERAWVEEFGFAPSNRELESLRLFMGIAQNIQHVGLYDPGIPLLEGFVRDRSGDSTKYPGLLSIKDITPHMMEMSDHFDPDGYVERKPEKVTVFKWVPVAQRTVTNT